MIREPRWKCLPVSKTLLVALALLSGGGCSGEPAADVSASNQGFTDAEMAEMRKSAKSVSEFRELMKLKLAERAGAAVTTKSAATKKK